MFGPDDPTESSEHAADWWRAEGCLCHWPIRPATEPTAVVPVCPHHGAP